ncbi:MAG: cyclic nucleotide-binding domain-containing protein, partial [Acidimicrobiia bacterium]
MIGTTASAAGVWRDLTLAIAGLDQRPMVVGGVESKEHRSADRRSVFLRHPDGRAHIRVSPEEFEMVELCDGSHTLGDLAAEWFVRNRNLAGLSRISNLLSALRTRGFLVGGGVDAYRELSRRLPDRSPRGGLRRAASRLRYSEFATATVEPLLAPAEQACAKVLRSPVLVAGAWALAAAGIRAGLRPQRQPHEHEQRVPWGGGTALAAVTLVGVLAHELGHAVAVTRSGRTVDRAGLAIVHGIPAAFVGTNDMCMASRRQRVEVALAGPFVGLMVAGICDLSALPVPESPVRALLAGAATVGGTLHLSNLVAFPGSDGHHALVDPIDEGTADGPSPLFSPLLRALRARRRPEPPDLVRAGMGAASIALWLRLAQPAIARPIRAGRHAPRVKDLNPSRVAGTIAVVLAVPTAVAFGQRAVRRSVARLRLRAEQHAPSADEALAQVPMFGELPESRFKALTSVARRHALQAGMVVFRQGDPGDRFYIISSGRLTVRRDGDWIADLGPGDYFGEMALLNAESRNATVTATAPSVLFSIDTSAFDANLADDLRTRARVEQLAAHRATLTSNPLFAGLSPAELDLLLAHFQHEHVAAGVELFHAGDLGDRFYLIHEGQVEALDHHGQHVTFINSKETFGELALLNDKNQRRALTIRATEPTEVLTLDATSFHDLLAAYCGRAELLH